MIMLKTLGFSFCRIAMARESMLARPGYPTHPSRLCYGAFTGCAGEMSRNSLFIAHYWPERAFMTDATPLSKAASEILRTADSEASPEVVSS